MRVDLIVHSILTSPYIGSDWCHKVYTDAMAKQFDVTSWSNKVSSHSEFPVDRKL